MLLPARPTVPATAPLRLSLRLRLAGILMDTNPILLAITTIVSLLHMVFEMLAFKNDVQFWRQRKSMEGLSLRSIAVSAVYQGIVLAYLWDNDPPWMILASSSVGL